MKYWFILHRFHWSYLKNRRSPLARTNFVQGVLLTTNMFMLIITATTRLSLQHRLTSSGPKMGQIIPQWEESVFFRSYSVDFGSMSQNVLKSDLRKSQTWGKCNPELQKLMPHWGQVIMLAVHKHCRYGD